MKKGLFILWLIIGNLSILNSQIIFSEFDSISFSKNYTPILWPGLGGLTYGNIEMLDINGDGLNDMVIFERDLYEILPFINNGSGSSNPYVYSPQYKKNFPEYIREYCIFANLDCDNIPELCHFGLGGVFYYKGLHNSNGEWTYGNMKEIRPYSFINQGFINVSVNAGGDIPLITDFDNDGDLDVVGFENFFPYMNYYKNLKVENNLPCDSNYWEMSNQCFGYVEQTSTGYFNTGIQCKTSGEGKTDHSMNDCMLALDYNNDSKKDIIIGAVVLPNPILLYNTNTNSNPIFLQDSFLKTHDNKPIIDSFMPCPFLLDYNNDQKNDLVFSSNAYGYNTDSIFIMLKNTGTNSNLHFVLDQNNWLNNATIDVGTYSKPTFVDYDHDGDLDLFIGSNSTQTNSGHHFGRLAYYKNVGANSNPIFNLETNDFLNLNSRQLDNISPAFGDADADGDLDLLIGTFNKLLYFKNIANNINSIPNLVYVTDTFAAMQCAYTQYQRPYRYLSPLFYDLNKDGKQDLILGEKFGNLTYFENNSSTGNLNFTCITDIMGGIDVSRDHNPLFDPFYSEEGMSVPSIGVLDNSGDTILLVGTIKGGIYAFKDISNPLNSFTLIDSEYNKILSNPNIYYTNSAPAIANLYNNDKKVIVVGNVLGGIQIFKRFKNLNDSTDLVKTILPDWNIKIYPNPTQNMVYIDCKDFKKYELKNIFVFDILGRKINEIPFDNSNIEIDLENFSTGIYQFQIYSEDGNNRVYKVLKR